TGKEHIPSKEIVAVPTQHQFSPSDLKMLELLNQLDPEVRRDLSVAIGKEVTPGILKEAS
ncbi:hypothetical protein ACSLO3_27545, partial [Escherichia coli]